MKNDPLRSYATEALRLYARFGKKSAKTLEEKTFSYYFSLYGDEKRAKDKTEEYRALFDDISAVEKTLEYFSEDKNLMKNVEDVYFYLPSYPLKKTDVTNRIRFSSLDEGVSERAVFARLKKVRLVFSSFRGLNTGEIPDNLK